MIKLVFLVSIIIVLCVLILYINTFKNENFKNANFDNNEKWNDYRLADIYKYWSNPKYEKRRFEYIDSIPSQFPGSIGSEYVSRNDAKKINFNLLLKIVDERTKKIPYSPKPNELILHLRIGDSIKGYDPITDKFKYHYSYATKFENIKKNIDVFKGKHVIIFYGIHASWAKKEYSELYLKKIRELFKNNNITFEEKSNGNPDEDFLRMCNAKIFVKSGGGYSNLISQIVKRKQNKVIVLN